jgi:hypothetical protein
VIKLQPGQICASGGFWAIKSGALSKYPSVYCHFRAIGAGIFDCESTVNRFSHLGSAAGESDDPLYAKTASVSVAGSGLLPGHTFFPLFYARTARDARRGESALLRYGKHCYCCNLHAI